MVVSDLIDVIDWSRLCGICPRESDGVIKAEVYLKINRASYRMLNRGDFIGTMQLVRFCISSGCITLPRQVERVDQAMLCGVPLNVTNPWHQFIAPMASRYGGGYFGGFGPFTWTSGSFEDRGYYATFRDVIPGSKKLRIYPESPNDVGKEVYIQGLDDNGQYIIEDPDYNGFKLTLAMPYVESSYFVSSVMGVIKPVTDNLLNLYEVDTENSNSRRLIAQYDPAETTVELRRYRVPGFNCCTNTGEETDSTKTLLALVKIKHLPVSRETDYLVIENPAAFEEMIRSLEHKDANQPKEAAEAELNAVRELNLEKRNRSPGQQIAVRLRTQGTAQPWRKGVGAIW